MSCGLSASRGRGRHPARLAGVIHAHENAKVLDEVADGVLVGVQLGNGGEARQDGSSRLHFSFKLGLHVSPEKQPKALQARPQVANGTEPRPEAEDVTTGSTKRVYRAGRSRAERRDLRRAVVVPTR